MNCEFRFTEISRPFTRACMRSHVPTSTFIFQRASCRLSKAHHAQVTEAARVNYKIQQYVVAAHLSRNPKTCITSKGYYATCGAITPLVE